MSIGSIFVQGLGVTIHGHFFLLVNLRKRSCAYPVGTPVESPVGNPVANHDKPC